MFNVEGFDVAMFDSILAKGLSIGMGTRGEQVCIEAAICQTLGLPHSDDPGCVADSVREFKVTLNDCQWSSPAARAKGLRDLGLAQLGSKGVVSDMEFTRRLAEKTVRVLIPRLFRQLFPDHDVLTAAANRCEKEGTSAAAAEASWAAARASSSAAASWSADSAAWAADSARWAVAWAAARAADSAAWVAYRDGLSDSYLILSAELALQVLRELSSPGCKLLERT